MSRKIYGFYHISLTGPWSETIEAQIDSVITSEAYGLTEKIFVSILGPIDINIDLPDKFEIFNRSVNINDLENNTMEHLRHLSSNPDFIGYFFHSHGVPYPYSDETFLTSSSQMLLEMLTNVDTRVQLALNYGMHAFEVFSLMGSGRGQQEIFQNWWWVSSDYIKTLPIITYSDTRYFTTWFGGESFFSSPSIFYNSQLDPSWPDLTLPPYTVPEDLIPTESEDTITETPLIESFKQGYRLKEGDLSYAFYNDEVYYPYSGLSHKLSPYWVRYEVGRIQESNNAYYPLGSLFRIPEESMQGVWRPNFIIGEDWKTGLYKIRWKFKVSADSPVEYIEVSFLVTTAGILDNSEDILGGYMNLPADLRIID